MYQNNRLKSNKGWLAGVFLGLIMNIPQVMAHGEAIEINEGTPMQTVHLTPEQTQMLDLKVLAATSRPMALLLSLNGQIQLLPNAQADVSIRISGAVTAINANLGDKVSKNQVLATVQSRLIGDPPPSVAVKAPIEGIIDARNVNLGQAVEPNTVLFHLSNREQLLVVAQVYEEDLGKIKVGQEVRIHALSYPQQIFSGKVILIEPNLNALTRTVNVQISLENQDNLLKPGMFVRANLVLSYSKAALTVPNNSILEADNVSFVFVRKHDSYERIIVKTGASDDNYTEITSGLMLGDEVVTQGNRELYTISLSGGSSASEHEDHH